MISATFATYFILLAALFAAIAYCLSLKRQLLKSKSYARLFQECHHPWLICNAKLELLETNQYARSIFGDNCLEQTLDQLLDKPLAHIKRLIEDNSDESRQLPGLFLVSNTQRQYWVTINVARIDAQHYSLFFTRAERQHELEYDIVQENIMAAKGQCYAGLLHEIGNPVAAIDGMLAELHQQISGLSPQQNNYFELLKSQLERINRIRYKTAILSSQNNNCELYSLNDHLTGLTELFAFDKRAKGTKLQATLDSGLPAIKLDQDKLTQVVINLISNSLDACHDNDSGEIEISTSYHQKQLSLNVSDNGCGMTKEVRRQALKAHFSTKGKGKGSGLGLNICKTLITELDGTIEIFSNHNAGTQVSLSFQLQE